MEDLEGICQRYADERKRFLVYLTTDVDLTEELPQKMFYQAVKSIVRYDGTCKLSVWLCQIAEYLYSDHLKRKRRHLDVSNEDLVQSGIVLTIS